MDEKEFNWVNNKIVYSLSFILIIFELREFIISWFPENFSLKFFNLLFTVSDLIDFMLMLLLLSLYLYGINYLIKNPLNKIRRFLNYAASFLWFLFLIFPIFVLVLMGFNSIMEQKDGLYILITALFLIINALMSKWSQNQSTTLDLMLIDHSIEHLRLKYTKQDAASKFVRNYLIMELLLKKALVNKTGISLATDKFVKLESITGMLSDYGLLNEEMVLEIKNLISLRNKVFHSEQKITQRELKSADNKLENLLNKLEDSFPKDKIKSFK